MRHPYTLDVISGDSGSPVFCVVNGQLVLLACNYTAIFGAAWSYHIAEIDTALTSVGSSYQLTTVNMGGTKAFKATTLNGKVTSFPTY